MDQSMSRPLLLYRLQRFDSQLDKARARLHQIEVILGDNSTVKAAEGMVAKANEELQAAQTTLMRAENKVKDQRTKIEQNEAKLYSGKVRNPKELQDLQNEVAALKRYLEVLEDRQLEAMLLADDAAEAFESAQKALEEKKAKTEDLHADLLAEQGNLQQDVNQLEDKRKATLGSILEGDLKQYNRLRAQRGGVAVAKVTNKACSACGTTLSAALNQAARSPNQITFCDTCGRILYSE
jgi:predicted  nucleic acid-binding Zn-ribbon protein